MTTGESFPRLLLAEWTKLRSVNRWVLTLVGAAVLSVGLSSLAASGSRTDLNEHGTFVTGPSGEPVSDEFFFVHQRISGDATLTVRVASFTTESNRPNVRMASEELTRLDDPGPFARPAAGIMIKDGARPGASYASVLRTDQGVRMQWDFDADRRGSASTEARWLRLVRSGATITGYESADGTTWQRIGTATPANLPSTAEIGFYVSSPPARYMTRGGGSSSVGERPTNAQATFDNVRLDSTGTWQGDAITVATGPAAKDIPAGGGGRLTESGGTYTVAGTGKIGPQPPDDDMVTAALVGTLAGLMALIAVGVLYATSEYRRNMIRTTFTATPRRGRVLAAKAIVLGAVCFVTGLVAAVGSFLFAIPVLRRQGFTRPAFPEPALTDPSVLRALVLTATFMAGVAVVGLAIGMLLRHSAAAITITVLLVLLPLIVGMILPGTSPKWLLYTTLVGGLATHRAKPPTATLAEPWSMIGPWAGITVVAAWVVVALGLAWWYLRRRDT
ncbi:ABC transporter permease subunit [Actinoplanes aureus]|uniref:ABC transporter permease subunit n=1 Tax=Actinoplanes aureus TaxID=2792083 RepID=A0A931G3F1_9ACTN|nr:ABC transporter permease subunit [Actinoplanes aureus]MBG0564209.1 ABC transporter permease subunit [Actinoplanes aureus]